MQKELIFMTDQHKKDNNDLLKENLVTYEDYASFDDNNRYELVQGKLELMSPSPSTIHQLVNAGLFKMLHENCTSDYYIFYAPIDVILSPYDVRQPDIVLVHRNRTDILSKRGIEGTPDLVIEIISPSSLKRDKVDKIKTYAQFYIPEYWIVDPNSETLEQYVLKDERFEIVNIFQNDETVTSPNINCVSFKVNEIFADLPKI
mgnify:CR=1 FL=1